MAPSYKGHLHLEALQKLYCRQFFATRQSYPHSQTSCTVDIHSQPLKRNQICDQQGYQSY